MSCVTFHVSCVKCHESRVVCHISCVTCHILLSFFALDKVVKLVSGGSVINGLVSHTKKLKINHNPCETWDSYYIGIVNLLVFFFTNRMVSGVI